MDAVKIKPTGLNALLADDVTKSALRILRPQRAVTPDKYNLVEVQRKALKAKKDSSPIPKHLDSLHKLDEKRSATRELLFKQKQEDAERTLPTFKPELNYRSEAIMRDNASEMLNRTMEWQKHKTDKLASAAQQKQDAEREREYKSMCVEREFPKSKLDVDSKVRMLLEMAANKLNRSVSPVNYTSVGQNSGFIRERACAYARHEYFVRAREHVCSQRLMRGLNSIARASRLCECRTGLTAALMSSDRKFTGKFIMISKE